MLKNERQREIVNLLKLNEGLMTVTELSRTLYASESSIRRDLSALEERGVIRRTHGGAELVTNFSNAIAFNKRAHHNMAAKKAIAKKAATLISDDDVIFLDQSSTAYYLANEILDKKSITVITNNIEIVSLLSNTRIKTVCSGGVLGSDNRTCLLGSAAEKTFEDIYADLVFFSTKSLTSEGVIFDCDRDEVFVRKAMLENANEKVFLCDSEKIDSFSAFKQCTLDTVDYLVCENKKAEKFKDKFPNLKIL